MQAPDAREGSAAHPVVDHPVFRLVDALSGLFARIGDVMLVITTVFLTYEVVARYIFRSPTRWTMDVSTTLMIWFTFIAMAMALRDRHMIRITAALVHAPARLRKVAEAFSIAVIACFCLFAAVYCFGLMMESVRLGRRQPTMLQMPNWVAELPVIIGFTLLFLQSLVELVRVPFRPAPDFSAIADHDGAVEAARENRP